MVLLDGNAISEAFKLIWYYKNLEIQFRSIKCTVVTRLRKKFEQLFIPSKTIQGDYSALM